MRNAYDRLVRSGNVARRAALRLARNIVNGTGNDKHIMDRMDRHIELQAAWWRSQGYEGVPVYLLNEKAVEQYNWHSGVRFLKTMFFGPEAMAR